VSELSTRAKVIIGILVVLLPIVIVVGSREYRKARIRRAYDAQIKRFEKMGESLNRKP
jgi:hypothetical protein